MKSNFGEVYFDHYEKYLGQTIHREAYQPEMLPRSMQVLAYDKVFKESVVFCTIGLSHYSNTIGENSEIYVPVDDGLKYVPKILAETASYIAEHAMQISWGMSIKGIKNISPDFYRKFRKEALYITLPWGLPDEFHHPTGFDDGSTGNVYAGIFISEDEHELFLKIGAEKFEEHLQDKNIDPININRGYAH